MIVLEVLRKEYFEQAERATADAYGAIGHEVNLGEAPSNCRSCCLMSLDCP